MKNYEIIEHTADMIVRIKGRDLKNLFVNAGLAIFQISSEKQQAKYPEKHKIIITQKADDIEELFINWLNELLSLSAVEGLVFEDIIISDISDKSVEAVATGTDLRNYKVNSEIKAATYHQLKIEKMQSGWLAEVVFDV